MAVICRCCVVLCCEMLTKQWLLCNLIFMALSNRRSESLPLPSTASIIEPHLYQSWSSPGATVGDSQQLSQCHICAVLLDYVEQCVQCPHPRTDHNSVTTFFCFWQATSPVVTRHCDYHKSLWSTFADAAPI